MAQEYRRLEPRCATLADEIFASLQWLIRAEIQSTAANKQVAFCSAEFILRSVVYDVANFMLSVNLNLGKCYSCLLTGKRCVG